jgi:DNA-binding transcriptional regulator YhcF (GntR family)
MSLKEFMRPPKKDWFWCAHSDFDMVLDGKISSQAWVVFCYIKRFYHTAKIPAITKLTFILKMSATTITKALRDLEKNGMITIQRSKNGNEYFFESSLADKKELSRDCLTFLSEYEKALGDKYVFKRKDEALLKEISKGGGTVSQLIPLIKQVEKDEYLMKVKNKDYGLHYFFSKVAQYQEEIDKEAYEIKVRKEICAKFDRLSIVDYDVTPHNVIAKELDKIGYKLDNKFNVARMIVEELEKSGKKFKKKEKV